MMAATEPHGSGNDIFNGLSAVKPLARCIAYIVYGDVDGVLDDDVSVVADNGSRVTSMAPMLGRQVLNDGHDRVALHPEGNSNEQQMPRRRSTHATQCLVDRRKYRTSCSHEGWRIGKASKRQAR